MLELESGSSSEYSEVEGQRRTLSAMRVGSLLTAVGLVGMVAYFSFGSPLKGKTSDAIGESEAWIDSRVFTPVGLTGSMKPSVANTPQESMNDGNKCNDDEEELGGQCFKKCSILTGGTHPTRTSAFTCCEAADIKDCGLKNQQLNLKPCGGFDVAGNINGQQSACPHSEGNCYSNEELFLGQCYKKCSELTNNEYNKRISSWSCCKGTAITDCNPFSGDAVKTSASFNVGGGASGTGDAIHPPDPCLDEANCKQAVSSASSAVAGAASTAGATAQSAYNTAAAGAQNVYSNAASLFPSSSGSISS